jgi:hypothetical protein
MNTSAHRHITNTHTTHNMQHTRWASPPGLRGFQIRCNGFALTRHTHTHTHIHPRTRIHTHMHKRISCAKIGTMWVSTDSLTEYTPKSAVDQHTGQSRPKETRQCPANTHTDHRCTRARPRDKSQVKSVACKRSDITNSTNLQAPHNYTPTRTEHNHTHSVTKTHNRHTHIFPTRQTRTLWHTNPQHAPRRQPTLLMCTTSPSCVVHSLPGQRL